jgi:UDP-N-acetylmuramate dehydrogenase
MTDIQNNAPLAQLTSFRTGGLAESLAHTSSSAELADLLKTSGSDNILGFGCNVVISDHGLQGLTVINRTANSDDNSGMCLEDETIVADAGCWWSDLTSFAAQQNLWGMELTHGIPGSVGAAVVGNIAAYGQAVADTLTWVEIYDKSSQTTKTIFKNELQFDYRSSIFHKPEAKDWVILRAAFKLSPDSCEVKYAKAIEAAEAIKADLTTLSGRTKAILYARKLAGSLYDPNDSEPEKTAGSFFKNPVVSAELADYIMNFEEHGVSKDKLRASNAVHGGDEKRISAALVLLSAGFKRGQEFGRVRLHPSSVLKLENFNNCSSTEIYDLSKLIQEKVKSSLDVELECEVKFLGRF